MRQQEDQLDGAQHVHAGQLVVVEADLDCAVTVARAHPATDVAGRST